MNVRVAGVGGFGPGVGTNVGVFEPGDVTIGKGQVGAGVVPGGELRGVRVG